MNPDVRAAAGSLAIEAYHAGNIRAVLAASGFGFHTQAVRQVRALLRGVPNDYGVISASRQNTQVIRVDSNAVAFSRTPQQVVNIVYLVGVNHGFFPGGLDGTITETTTGGAARLIAVRGPIRRTATRPPEPPRADKRG